MPYIVGVAVLNSTEVRSIHLAFAIFLAYLAYPALKSSPRKYIPILDWVLASVAAFCAAYIFLFYRELSERPGLPTTTDLVVSVVGIVLILEATRRALGPPLAIVCLVFIWYTFGGHLMPEVIAHKGASLNKGYVALLSDHRGRIRRRPRRVGEHGISVRIVRIPAGEGRRRQLLHPRSLCPHGTSAGRAGEGCRRVLGHDRPDFRIGHRQRGDHRHLHDSPDAQGGVLRGKSRGGGSGVLTNAS